MKNFPRALLYQDYDSTDDFIDDNDQSGIFRDFLSAEQFTINVSGEASILSLWNEAMYICAYFASKRHPDVCYSEIWKDSNNCYSYHQSGECSRLLAYILLKIILPDKKEKERLMRKIEQYNAMKYGDGFAGKIKDFIGNYAQDEELKSLCISPRLRCVEKTTLREWNNVCDGFKSKKAICEVLRLYHRKSDQRKALSAIRQAYEEQATEMQNEELPF